MIHLYSGTPGSGKSLHTARDIRDALRIRKMPVIANFDVNHSLRNYDRLFTYLPNDRLDPSFLEDFAVSLEDADLSSEPFLNRPPFFSSVASATEVGFCSSSSRLALRC